MAPLLSRTWRAVALAGGAGYLVATGVTLVDVVGRGIGVTLIRGAIDIVVVSMVLAASFAVAQAEARDANVRVEPLSAWIPKRMRGGVDRFWSVVGTVLFAAIAWRSAQEALLVHSFGEILPAIGISVAVLGLLVAVGFGLGALAALAVALRRGATDTLIPPPASAPAERTPSNQRTSRS